jgi:hypothetical protein
MGSSGVPASVVPESEHGGLPEWAYERFRPLPFQPMTLIVEDLQFPSKGLAIRGSTRNTIPPGGNPAMNLRVIFTNVRLIFWPLCMAYVAFLLAGSKNAPSLNVVIIAAFLGALIGFALGIMFANRAHRRHRENVLGKTIARIYR